MAKNSPTDSRKNDLLVVATRASCSGVALDQTSTAQVRLDDGLPATGFVREPKVLEVFPVSHAHWWAGIAAGRYPRGVKLSKRITAWPVEAIRKLIADLKSQ